MIVDGAGAASHRWQEALAECCPEIVATVAEASSTGDDDVAIVDLPELGEPALASIREAFVRRMAPSKESTRAVANTAAGRSLAMVPSATSRRT
ncbi:MAG: hypothetical protein JWP87_1599 [Labilithrix sp.]|nr:hypothetical protein [Labilithrix sp.]